MINSHKLNFNTNKVRWLNDCLFVIGSGNENQNKIGVVKFIESNEANGIELLAATQIDGDVTEIRCKNSNEEFFVSTTKKTIFLFHFDKINGQLIVLDKWSLLLSDNSKEGTINFDFNSGINELCCVDNNGCIHFIYTPKGTTDPILTIPKQELGCLNCVIYLGQTQVAVGNSLGRIKLFDTSGKNKPVNLAVDGDCSPILCLTKSQTQQYVFAAGNLNGVVFVYDVRDSQKPSLIMTHNNSKPIFEIGFSPFSSDNLFSSSFDGSLWFWSFSPKNKSMNHCIIENNIDARNILPTNRYSLNSFDINNDHLIAVNNNNELFTLKISDLSAENF